MIKTLLKRHEVQLDDGANGTLSRHILTMFAEAKYMENEKNLSRTSINAPMV